MSKTFKYTKFGKYHYCEFSDEWEEDGTEFEYEVEDDRLLDVVVDLLYYEQFEGKIEKEELIEFIEEFDLLDKIADGYEERLKEIFEKEAFENYGN
jgi:hypothetical protein